CLAYPPLPLLSSLFFFLFKDTAPPEIYTLSLHDALPIYLMKGSRPARSPDDGASAAPADDASAASPDDGVSPAPADDGASPAPRSEEHTSELQSRENLVCRLLLEKKKNMTKTTQNTIVSC